ncbi:SMI1/KNR4 family protein [Phenylobacterium sp.]|uniref:SMI1/KNR4 family protein n=1 Tax=Phenylobacterium sp. TaxID=1871053 RepID=UPI002FC71A3D
MKIPPSEACQVLDDRGVLKRHRQDHSARIIEHVNDLIGGVMPADLEEFYKERIYQVADFLAVSPIWNDHVGWRTDDSLVTRLLRAQAVPLFWDGCGSLYGLDLTVGESTPGVYFFDHEDEFARPRWATGSSLGAFLLLLAEHDQALDEGRAAGWELSIDPDIDKCSRAPALWLA